MSVNFSTIGPLTQETISRKPAFSTETAPQPAASTSMDRYGHPKEKKSHWFVKTLAAAVIVVAGLGLAKKYGLKEFDPSKLPGADAKKMEKFTFEAKKLLHTVGGKINEYADKAWKGITGIFGKKADKADDAAAAATTAAEGAAGKVDDVIEVVAEEVAGTAK